MKINYKSDFDFILRLTDCKGVNIGFPDFDWEAKFYTNSKANAFVASSRNGKTVNCFNDEGQIHVVVDGHKMGIGNLNVEMRMELPNDIYPDGVQNDVQPMPLDIELVSGQGDCPTTAEIEVRLPYINGNITDELLAYIKKEIDKKADRTELSNIIGDPTEEEIENISPTLVTEALRKVPQLLTPDEQAQVKQNIGVSKMELFIDLWNTACGIWGRYNKETGYFELNSITDITYEEALIIFFHTISFSMQCSNRISTVKDIRTNLPLQINPDPNGINTIQSFRYFCSNNNNLEVLNFSTFSGSRISPNLGEDAYQANVHIVYGCPKLKRIVGNFSLFNATKNMWPFNMLPELEEVNISHLYTGTLHLEMLPKLNLNSFSYLVNNKYQNADPTVMVHPSVYTKLTDETNTEWHQVLLDAADKNITFATI